MNNTKSYALMIPTKKHKLRGFVYRWLRKPYLVTALVGYLLIIAMVLLYLNKAPIFTSEMDLVLPGTGSNSNVSLNEVGEVVSSTTTPYASSGFNPRVNYKEMLSSRSVIERAALSLNISVKDFGNAKIKLTEQTSIISIEVSGLSPSLAKSKASALYESLQQELDRLRADEVDRRDESIKAVLAQYYIKLDNAREKIVDFQQHSIVVSTVQLDQMVRTLADLNEKQMLVSSELERMDSYIRQLSLNLGVSPVLAGQVFQLQTDAKFSSYLTELDQSLGELSQYSSRWGTNHPKVIAAQQRVYHVNNNLKQRSVEMIGIHVSESFNTLDLKKQNNRSKLFADLIDSSAMKEGKKAQLSDVEQSIVFVRDKLKIFSREVAELKRLEHSFNIAEAVYTSAAARLEASKSDIFASYPVIQQLTSPSYTEDMSSPNDMIAIAAGFVGILLISLFLVALWQRHSLIRVLLSKN